LQDLAQEYEAHNVSPGRFRFSRISCVFNRFFPNHVKEIKGFSITGSIGRLKLYFEAEQPHPPHSFRQEFLLATEEKEAEKVFRKIFDLEIEVMHLDGWYSLGDLFCLQGKFDKAEEKFREGLKRAEEMQHKDGIRDFHDQLAALALRRGNIERAIEEIEKGEVTWPLTRICIYA